MKIKLLIVVKTYPTLTTNYEESVCTAGITEEGKWIRIYPVQFRKLNYSKQYKKYDWVEIDIERHHQDFRPESYRPLRIDAGIEILNSIDTKNKWQARKEFVLKNVYDDFDNLIKEAKEENLWKSIAVFKPYKFKDFIITEYDNKTWDKKKLDKLKQLKIFEEQIKPVDKIPYKFVYIFEDIKKKVHRLMAEDWELYEFFRKSEAKFRTRKELYDYVKKRFFDELALKRDLYFILGTTRIHHIKSKNPFIIIGLFYPPKVNSVQEKLF